MYLVEDNNNSFARHLVNILDLSRTKLLTVFVARAFFLVHAMFLTLALLASGDALALNLKDRLELPAKKFTQVDKSAFLDIYKTGNRILSVGERGVIAYSDDAGESWQQASVPVSTMLTSVHFVDDKLGWAVGHSGVVLNTQDGGESWALQFDGLRANAALVAEAKEKLAEIQLEYDEADEEDKEDLIYDLEDAEFVLSNAEFDSELGAANPFLDVFFENENQGYAVGAYGLFFATSDGGQSWHPWSSRIENFDRYHLNAIKTLSDGTILLVGEGGVMFASYDQGEYWETLYGSYQGSYFGIEDVGSEGEVIVYGLKGNVYKSFDQGQSWERIVVPVETSLTSSSSDGKGSIVLTGFSGVLLRSRDGGDSFEKIENEGLEGFNGVARISDSRLMLVSDKGVHFHAY